MALRFDPFVVSQILVGAAFLFDLLSFQLKERRQILLSLVVSCALVALHFLLLANPTAGGLFLLIALRFLVSAYSTSKIYMLLFIVLGIALAAITYERPLNLLALAGSLVGTWASFQDNDRLLRKLMMFGTCLWIVHNTLALSPAAAALEIFFLASNVFGYYRFYIRTSLGSAAFTPHAAETSGQAAAS